MEYTQIGSKVIVRVDPGEELVHQLNMLCNRLNITLGTIRDDFDACLIGTGSVIDRQLDIPGAELAQPAMSFLRQVNLGQKATMDGRVVILGGGGVAFDCALTARRLGASEVSIICVEGEDCMCADPEDVQQARAANVCILNSKLACTIIDDAGRLTGVELFIFDSQTGETNRITSEPLSHTYPAWSHDGRFLAFAKYINGSNEIFLLDMDTKQQIQITDHPANDTMPSWSPDDRQIAFVSNREGNKDIYIMNVDGGELFNLTNHPADDWYPSWSPVLPSP